MNLDFLTIDIGSIIFNLANTLILFLVIKHFLFKPVNDIIEQRKHDVEETYSLADEALENARQSEKKYNDLIGNAREESAKIIKNASETANRRSEEIISEAKSNADMIIKKANSEIEVGYFEHFLRDYLNLHAERAMAVFEPLKVTLTNFPDGNEEENFEINPNDEAAGTRKITVSKHIYIDQEDF